MEKVHLGGGGLGRKDTRVCMTESLCYSLGTAALLIGCTPIQSALVLKKRPHVSSECQILYQRVNFQIHPEGGESISMSPLMSKALQEVSLGEREEFERCL